MRVDDGRERTRVVADGDFEAFFRSTLQHAVAAAFRVTGDRFSAEDAAVQALAKAYVRWRRLREKEWRQAWVIRVTVNEAIDGLPRRLALPRDEPVEDLADDVVLRQTLRAALRSLPKRQREVIALRYLLGLSEKEVAEMLDISPGTVKTHVRRGIAVLRRLVGTPAEEDRLAQLARY